MNTLTIIKLMCGILIADCVICQRISQLKCVEMASLNTGIDSTPYLMKVVQYIGEQEFSFATVTLISEDYLLTTANLIVNKMRFSRENIVRNQQFIVRKSISTDDNRYPDTQFFTIKRLIPHELFNNSNPATNDIGLIQLNEPVPYLNSTSIFRPACLWTDNIVRASDNIYSYLAYDSKFKRLHNITKLYVQIKPATITTINKCTKYIGILNDVGSNICLNANLTYNRFFSHGTPIEVKVGSTNYIFAVLSNSFYDAGTIVIWGTKVSSFIPWIESIVWPNYSDQKMLFECGQRKVKHKPLMTYAQPTYHGEFPWHVALYRNQKYSCGGTILNSRTILTAAHCVHDERGKLPPNRITIVAGTHNLNEYPIEAQNYVVDVITVHQNYTRTYLENDIALLILSVSIEFSSFIQPICLSNIVDYSNITMGLVAGWGRNEYNQSSDILLQATFPIIDEFECRDSNRNFFPTYLNSRNYCAGYGNGTNVCSGDSGGSMIFEYKSRWFIRGIVSLGVAVPHSNACDVTQLVLFTDVVKFYNWIENEKFTEI